MADEICVDVRFGMDSRRILEDFIERKKALNKIKDVRIENRGGSFTTYRVCGDKESMKVIRSTFSSTISSLKNNTVRELENFFNELVDAV